MTAMPSGYRDDHVAGQRALLIVNRASGSGFADVRAMAAAIGEHGFEVAAHAPEDPSTISDLIRQESRNADRVILGGGDGTFSRAAQALIDAGKPVGFLPMGTANDLARTLNIPLRLPEAVRLAATGLPQRIDLGVINGRPFFNVASMGFSVRVAQFHQGERKRRLGVLGYPLSWLDAQRGLQPFRVELDSGKKTRKYRSTMVAVGNGVFYGGGMKVAEDAGIQDGLLDVFHIDAISPLGMLKLLPFLRFGLLKRRREVKTLRVPEITIRTEPVQQINVDGEIVEQTPATFGVSRGALEVIVGMPNTE